MRRVFISGIFALIYFVFSNSMAQAHQGSIHIVSAHDVPTTVERFINAVEAKGAKVFATVDHAKGAASVGIDMEPTVLIIFGNPKLGTPLIQSHRMKGLDVPLRVLIAKEGDEVRVNYNDPQKMCRINANEAAKAACMKISKILDALAHQAAGQ